MSISGRDSPDSGEDDPDTQTQLYPGDIIASHKMEIFNRWLETALETIPHAREQSRTELANHLEKQLEALVAALEPGYGAREVRSARELPTALHGRERASVRNWSAAQLAQEYILLRRVLTDYCRQFTELDETAIATITTVIEDSLLSALDEFQHSVERVQQKLMATLVHDVRTPLGIAKLHLALLEGDGIPDQDLAHYRSVIGRNLDRCLRMLESLLDSARAESGQGLHMRFQRTDLSGALRVVCQEADEIYMRRIIDDLGDQPVEGVFDEALIVRTVENLISNALKFGYRTAPICVTLRDHGDHVSLCVKNEGKPIPEDVHQRMFEFFASPADENNAARGWGLGLALIKTVAHSHGGEVIFESSEEKGTIVGMTLMKHHHREGEEITVPL